MSKLDIALDSVYDALSEIEYGESPVLPTNGEVVKLIMILQKTMEFCPNFDAKHFLSQNNRECLEALVAKSK